MFSLTDEASCFFVSLLLLFKLSDNLHPKLFFTAQLLFCFYYLDNSCRKYLLAVYLRHGLLDGVSSSSYKRSDRLRRQ